MPDNMYYACTENQRAIKLSYDSNGLNTVLSCEHRHGHLPKLEVWHNDGGDWPTVEQKKLIDAFLSFGVEITAEKFKTIFNEVTDSFNKVADF